MNTCCDNPSMMGFNVFTLDVNGYEYATDKQFFISLEESNEFIDRYGWGINTKNKIYLGSILVCFFEKIYNWDIGANGFSIRWDHEPNYKSATVSWHGRGNHWRLKRII